MALKLFNAVKESLQITSSIFKSYANIKKCDQIIIEPTRITPITSSLLEHILCNNKDIFVSQAQFL